MRIWIIEIMYHILDNKQIIGCNRKEGQKLNESEPITGAAQWLLKSDIAQYADTRRYSLSE